MERADEFISALADGDKARVSVLLQDMLSEYVSVGGSYDKADPEDYYLRFLNLMFKVSSKKYSSFESRTCAADDGADITFSSLDHSIAVVLDLKTACDKTELGELAECALEQIRQKNYIGTFTAADGVEKVCCYGIAFYRRKCQVRCETKEL